VYVVTAHHAWTPLVEYAIRVRVRHSREWIGSSGVADTLYLDTYSDDVSGGGHEMNLRRSRVEAVTSGGAMDQMRRADEAPLYMYISNGP
jgi:hypothetical protein